MRLSRFLLTSFAQVAPEPPQASYEGARHRRVSPIANPHRDLEPLRACITLRPGDPYSEEQIRASAEALEKAGGFPKVAMLLFSIERRRAWPIVDLRRRHHDIRDDQVLSRLQTAQVTKKAPTDTVQCACGKHVWQG
jgi:hypothetical protein